MTEKENRELKWTCDDDTIDWLHIGEWVHPGRTIADVAGEWRAFATAKCKDAFTIGPETGARGRRCAESALVDAGVITRAEADGLVWAEVEA